MVLDVLENAHRYLALNKGFAHAVDFLLRPDLKELPVGKYEIESDRVYAMVSKGPGRRKEEGRLETHERYIDIQFVLAGTDTMGWKPRAGCRQLSREYNQKSDVQFFADEPDAWLPVGSGAFVIFFPEDAHTPLISSGEIHKVVVKVAMDHG
jgi:biofilm protein TabA